tara:strand:+ start:1529 stop:2326 length:798 start_codon:yes stop_codon:yes gene_type:complete
MASFTDKKISEVYKDILHTDNSNTGIDSNIKQIKCGDGDASALYLSDRNFKAQPSTDSTTNSVICDADGNALLTVDSTNDLVKAGVGQHTVNTQYAYFGYSSGNHANITTSRHYPLAFAGNQQTAALGDNFSLGTGTDPATSFTTADGSGTDASVVVPALWLVPDNITIDAVYSLEGGDNATGATTRMHLMSYTFNSGSTSALADGTLLAHNSDVTNAGSEQAYKSTWTVDSADVAGNKVILATFLTTDITGDYSTSVIVKYHLR